MRAAETLVDLGAHLPNGKALAVVLVVALPWVAFRVARFVTRLVLVLIAVAILVAAYFF